MTVEEPDPVEIADEPVKDPEPSLDLVTHTEVSDGLTRTQALFLLLFFSGAQLEIRGLVASFEKKIEIELLYLERVARNSH